MKTSILAGGFVAAALVLSGCASLGGNAKGVESLASGNHSNMNDQQYLDVHNQADFTALWTKTFANQSAAPAMPQVDFTKDMVLAAFLGQQKHGGYIVRIPKIDTSGATANVTVEVTVPGTNCRFLQSQTEPYLFVAAPATTKQVNFNVTQSNAPPCG